MPTFAIPMRLLVLTVLAVILNVVVGACASRSCRGAVESCGSTRGSSVERVEAAPDTTVVVMNVPGPRGDTAVVWLLEPENDGGVR